MLEIPIIYGQDRDGQRWIEFVCRDRKEAEEKLQYLKNKKVNVPEMDDQIWGRLGVGFIEREHIIKELVDFQRREQMEKPSYCIEFDYLNDESSYDAIDADGSMKVKVIYVSNENTNGNFIHWLTPVNADADVAAAPVVYKISLPERSAIGKEDTIDLKVWKVIRRPAGFTYKDKNGMHRILHSEYWLFIK